MVSGCRLTLVAVGIKLGEERNFLEGTRALRSFGFDLPYMNENFELGPALDAQLAQRRFRAGMTQEYRDWRARIVPGEKACPAPGGVS
jgi:hypothetical protein